MRGTTNQFVSYFITLVRTTVVEIQKPSWVFSLTNAIGIGIKGYVNFKITMLIWMFPKNIFKWVTLGVRKGYTAAIKNPNPRQNTCISVIIWKKSGHVLVLIIFFSKLPKSSWEYLQLVYIIARLLESVKLNIYTGDILFISHFKYTNQWIYTLWKSGNIWQKNISRPQTLINSEGSRGS